MQRQQPEQLGPLKKISKDMVNTPPGADFLKKLKQRFSYLSQRKGKKKRGKLKICPIDRGRGIWKGAGNHLGERVCLHGQ
jgi:hypothetical protein